MATNDNTTPLKNAKLPKNCYASWQEFADDFTQTLQLTQDTKEIIKGAEGKPGIQGPRGNKGDRGEQGPGTTKTTQVLNIPINAAFIEIDVFPEWQSAIFSIGYDGQVAPLDGSINTFLPASGYIGIGTIVLVGGSPTPTKLRIYFTFAGAAITSTPNANFRLYVTKFS